jgi:hypothetical protein
VMLYIPPTHQSIRDIYCQERELKRVVSGLVVVVADVTI